jgi:hypothetical protein
VESPPNTPATCDIPEHLTSRACIKSCSDFQKSCSVGCACRSEGIELSYQQGEQPQATDSQEHIMSRSIAIQQRSYIRTAVLGEVTYWKNQAQDWRDLGEKVPADTRGRLITLRYGAFIATLTLVLAYLGLSRSTARNERIALYSFVLSNRSRFRYSDLRDHKSEVYGAYSAWREWGTALARETVKRSNAIGRARREAAAANA